MDLSEACVLSLVCLHCVFHLTTVCSFPMPSIGSPTNRVGSPKLHKLKQVFSGHPFFSAALSSSHLWTHDQLYVFPRTVRTHCSCATKHTRYRQMVNKPVPVVCTLTQHNIYTSVEIVYLADSSLNDWPSTLSAWRTFSSSTVACGVDNFWPLGLWS